MKKNFHPSQTLYTRETKNYTGCIFMKSSFRNTRWIAIAFLAAISCLVAVIAITPAHALPVANTGAVTSGSAAFLQLQDGFLPQKESCTREAMDQCEYACLMPGGILDLNCYEDCIYAVC